MNEIRMDKFMIMRFQSYREKCQLICSLIVSSAFQAIKSQTILNKFFSPIQEFVRKNYDLGFDLIRETKNVLFQTSISNRKVEDKGTNFFLVLMKTGSRPFVFLFPQFFFFFETIFFISKRES